VARQDLAAWPKGTGAPRDRVPCDGQIIEGGSYLDESPINGESEPRYKQIEDGVFAGTINLEGVLRVEVTRGAEDNTIARIIRLALWKTPRPQKHRWHGSLINSRAGICQPSSQWPC